MVTSVRLKQKKVQLPTVCPRSLVQFIERVAVCIKINKTSLNKKKFKLKKLSEIGSIQQQNFSYVLYVQEVLANL